MDQASGGEPVPEHEQRRLSRNVRVAVEYIHAHAQERISVPEIAEVVHVTPRGLQSAFRRELGTTPGAYLRSVRLEGVRRDLQAGGPAVRTVTDVAKRWHFSNAGRMSKEYRALFGSAPSAAVRHFDPEDPVHRGPHASAPSRTAGQRFRIVLDCEVDIVDPETAVASVLQQAARGRGAWAGYQPDGGTEDLVALVLSHAIKTSVANTDGVRLLAVNPMLRVADESGGYEAAELPTWTPTTAHTSTRSESPDPRGEADG